MYGDDAWELMFAAWFIVVAFAILGVISIVMWLFF